MASEGQEGHEEAGHDHGISSNADRRYLWTALVLLLAFMVTEVIVALTSGSLVLLSDAGHMLSDVGAIAASLWAIRLAARPAAGPWTFGWKRAEILSAAGNGITLLVISGIVILTTGFTRADSIASLVVVGLMLKASWGLLRDSGRVLLEAAPRNIDLAEVRSHLLESDHVHDVHDLHVWTLTSNLPTLSAHVVIDDSCFNDGHAPQLLDQLQECLTGDFDVEHSTFQLEPLSHAAHEPGTH